MPFLYRVLPSCHLCHHAAAGGLMTPADLHTLLKMMFICTLLLSAPSNVQAIITANQCAHWPTASHSLRIGRCADRLQVLHDAPVARSPQARSIPEGLGLRRARLVIEDLNGIHIFILAADVLVHHQRRQARPHNSSDEGAQLDHIAEGLRILLRDCDELVAQDSQLTDAARHVKSNFWLRSTNGRKLLSRKWHTKRRFLSTMCHRFHSLWFMFVLPGAKISTDKPRSSKHIMEADSIIESQIKLMATCRLHSLSGAGECFLMFFAVKPCPGMVSLFPQTLLTPKCPSKFLNK